MRHFSYFLLALLTGTSALADTDWMAHPRWDEGLAEVSLYEGKMKKYGRLYPATLEIATVREFFSPGKLVKTTPGGTAIPVLKMNLTRRVRTGVYEYVQMASTFHDRRDGSLMKLSTVSAEWCGNSSVLFQREQAGSTLRVSSYFDDMGYNEQALQPGTEPLFYEELIPYLRGHLGQLRAGQTVRIADPLMSHKPRFATREAAFLDLKGHAVAWGGKKVPATSVTLAQGDTRETFTFLDDDLRTFFRWENDRGESVQLRKTLFLDYWNKNRPGDERLLK